MEAVECGAAALGIILGYHGRVVPLEELRRECGVSRDGSQASSVLRAARRYGVVAKGFKKDIDALLKQRCPYIVFWNFNHFVVVEGFHKDKVYLNDPGTGPRSVSLQEFSESYTGLLLTLEPGPDFKKGGSKPSLLGSLQERLKGSAAALLYCILAGLLLVLPGLAIPIFAQIFVDNVLVQAMTDWLRPLVFGMLLTAVLRAVLLSLQLKYLRRLRIKLGLVLSSRFMWHVLRLPVSFYAQRYAGEIGSRMTLNDKVADVLSGRLIRTAIDVVMIVFIAVVMFEYDALLASIGIAFAFMNLLALQWISRRRVDASLKCGQEFGRVSGVSIAGLQNIETLKASGLESDFFARWAGYFAKATNAQQDLGATNQKLEILPTLLFSLSSMLIIVIGGLRVLNGSFSIGMLVAFQSLMQSFLQPVVNLMNLGGTIQELRSDLTRLDDVLRASPDRLDEKGSMESLASAPPRLAGSLELRNIVFGYNRIAPPLIADFSLSIKPGQRVAIVGASGSGKSTIAKLVCGLYEPWEGEILFDGNPRTLIPRAVLTTSIALVEQDFFLFEGSVRSNLTLWDSTVTERHMVQACKDAEIHDAVIYLPGGYDALLIEGGNNLSGGQRQRLEIARALVNNPAILVLDEAMSALDTENEALIDRNLRLRGCSCLIIAHRVSTIRDCDEIIVLDQGKVVERGTHQELLLVNGHYSHLISGEQESVQSV